MTKGVSSPAILYMFGIISSRPCDAVNVVERAPACSAPWTAPAAPASDCISATSGIAFQRFVRPLLAHSAQTSAIGLLGAVGHLAMVSLARSATDAAASFPSTVIRRLVLISYPLCVRPAPAGVSPSADVVWRAIISSSFVGITHADTRLDGDEIRGPLPVLASSSRSIPSHAEA